MKDKGPLKGIKVVDLTAMVSGPTATMMLGDQGADVIKVEPLEGELMRKVGRSINGMTNSFLCCNRSNRYFQLYIFLFSQYTFLFVCYIYYLTYLDICQAFSTNISKLSPVTSPIPTACIVKRSYSFSWSLGIR